jgi:S-formylglutathione hydrolase FrmB
MLDTPGRPHPRARWPERSGLAASICVAGCLTGIPAYRARASVADALVLTAQRLLGARLSELTFRTPALRGDTHVRILLPAQYYRDARRRFPVLYLLHGGADNHRSWTTAGKGDTQALTAGLPLIVVMPDAGHAGWYTDWFNNGADGPPRWETYDIGQLIPWVDTNYRTIASRRGRAVAGVSMGGFGAMSYAAQYPDLFIAAAAFSGAVDTNTPPVIGPAIIDRLALLDGGPPGSIFGPYATQQVRWRGHNPWDLAGNLRGLTLVIRTGNGRAGGPYGGGGPSDVLERLIHAENVSFHERLTALGIPHVWDDYGPGGHDWPYWNRDLALTLPIFMSAFAHPPAPPSPVTYTSIRPGYEVYGWHVSIRREVLEFSTLAGADAGGLTLTGSGGASVVTPPLYPPGGSYVIRTRTQRDEGYRYERAAADSRGRLHLRISLGPSDTVQQYAPGAASGRHPVTASVTVLPDAAT